MSDFTDIKNIYIYRTIGLFVSFGSVFVVVPYLVTDAEAYAIYVFTISICFFLTYGDMGFLGAAQKYCAEEVGKGSVKSEVKFVGFVTAILIIIGFIFAGLMFVASLEPSLLLPQIDSQYVNLASDLFITTAIFMPIQVILQRLSMLVLTSRSKEHIAIRLDIAANVLKILIVPLFQSESRFLLEYFLLTSIVLSIVSALVAIITIKLTTNFPLASFIKNIRLSSESYNKMKGLAFSSLFATVCFILYFEFDLIIAARFYSLNDIAGYALAFILMNFIRSSSAIIYSPLMAYLNRIMGRNQKDKVNASFSVLLSITAPLFMSLILMLYLGSDPILFQWLGEQNILALSLFKVLLIGSFYAGIINAVPLIATTYERKHALYLIGLIPFLVFYLTFFITQMFFPNLGIMSIALAKCIAGFSAAGFSFYFLLSNSIIDIRFLLRIFYFSILSLVAGSYLVNYNFLFLDSLNLTIFGLIVTLLLIGISVILVWLVFIFFSKVTRDMLLNLVIIPFNKYRK